MLIPQFALIFQLAVAQHRLSQAEQAIHIRVVSRSEHFTSGVPGGILRGSPPQVRPPQPTPSPELTEFTISCRIPDCSDAVRLLLNSLDGSPKPRLDPSDFEPTLFWLRSATLGDLRSALRTPFHKLLFDKLSSASRTRGAIDAARRNPSCLEELLRNYYAGVSDHDSAVVEATLHLPGGRTAAISSSAEHAFMIPWRIREERSEYDTYQPDIGRALALLAPPVFTEAERLSGRRLRSELLELLIDRIDHEHHARPD